jgi:hypothetical protein
VEEHGDGLLIRRGSLEVRVPYSEILAHEFLKIGSQPGVKLTFKSANVLGTGIGFYLDTQVDPSTVPHNDPIEHMERQMEKYRHGRAV